MASFLRKLLLLLVPIYCVLFLNTVNINNSPLHASSCDPSYAYLFNSLNLASGYMKTGHWDHPGTPAQMLGAINLKANHLIYGNTDIVEDVIASPEFYLRKMSILQVLILAIFIFVLGLLTLKHTANLAVAFVLQVSPVVSHFAFYLSDKPIPEYFLVIGLLLFNYYCFLHILTERKKETTIAVALGLICGFLIATKFYVLPIIVIPLLILRKRNLIVRFSAVTMMSFVLFIFPIWTKLRGFVDFILNVATHSGQYGKGEKGIVNTDTYYDNLIMCFTQNIAFTGLLVLLGVGLLFLIVKKRGAPHSFVLGVLITVVAQVIIVAKHYSPHYLLSAEALVLPALFVLAVPLLFSTDESQAKLKRILNLSFVVLGLLLIASNFHMFKFYDDIENPSLETVRFLEEHEIKERIYPHSVYCPASEPALYYGGRYSGDREMKYKYLFDKQYPHSYFYNTNTSRMESWFVDLIPSEILIKHKRMLFIENQYVRGTLDLFLQQVNSALAIKSTMIHRNEKTNEKVFLLETDPSLENKRSLLLSCGMEKLSDDKGYFMADSSTIKFDGAMLYDTEVYKNGAASIRMDGTMHYAFHTDVPVEAGKNYKFEIWRYSPKDKGVLVVTNSNVEGFYFHCYYPVVKEKYWELLQVNVQVPKDFPEKTVRMYLWNPTKDVAYFDDLRIYEVY